MLPAMTCLGCPSCIPCERAAVRPCRAAADSRTPQGGAASRELLSSGIYFFPERGEADRAHDHLGAHDVARGAVKAQRLGDAHVLLDRGPDLVARHILLEPRQVEAHLFGGRERVRAIGWTAAAQQLLMELQV